MAQIFISYARPDEAAARRVAVALKAAGYDVWWDADLPAHRAYSDVIERNLKEAGAVVVLWSKAAAQSEWVRAEADYARTERKLVQGQLDGSLPPMPFNQIQCADLKGWRGSEKHTGWAKLKGSVAALLSGDEQVGPGAAPVSWWLQRRLHAAAALVLLLVVAAALLIPRWLGGEGGDRPVVAVLPFESLDQRDASLVAGIWEDTRQALSRNPQLLVLGPNTSEELADKAAPAIRKAADYLVRASVRSTGDRIRVSTALVRTKDDAQIWAEQFDRRLDDVFALQSEIAGEIEGRIRGRLAERGGKQPENIATSGEVYALYSDARRKIRKRMMRDYGQAATQLQQVVRMDPNFAPGWATLSVASAFGMKQGLGDPERHARRAIALAPNLAAGHAALGFALGRGPVAEAALRRALDLDPNDIEAMNWLANSFDATRAKDKLQLYSKIVELEPLWWPAILNKLMLLMELDDRAAAAAELERMRKLGDVRMESYIRMYLAAEKGDLSTAVNVGLPEFIREPAPEVREPLANLLWLPLLQLGLFDAADHVSPPPAPLKDIVMRFRFHDPSSLDLVEARIPAKEYWNTGPMPLVAGRIYLLSGNGARMVKRYHQAAASLAEFEQLVGPDRLLEVAPLIALAMRSAGEAEQANALLGRAEALAAERGVISDDEQVRLARIYAVQGRTNEALDLLHEAVRSGWVPDYLMVHTDIALDPALAELKKDPRFERLRRQILGHLAKERAEVGSVPLQRLAA